MIKWSCLALLLVGMMGCADVKRSIRFNADGMEADCISLGGIPSWFKHGPVVVGFACTLSLPEAWLHDRQFVDPAQ